MSVALLVLRVVVGGLFVGHGSQKLFGWFRGHGVQGTASFLEGVGVRPGVPLAILAGAAELCGGILLGVGLLVPVAALLLVSVMAAATATVHWRNGVWAQDGGFEYPLVMASAAFAVAAIGAGSISLDNALGVSWHGLGWAIAAVAVGALAGLAGCQAGRIRARRHDRAERTPTARTA